MDVISDRIIYKVNNCQCTNVPAQDMCRHIVVELQHLDKITENIEKKALQQYVNVL